MTISRPLVRWAATLLAGVAMVLTFAPFGAWWLQPLLLAVLLHHWRTLPPRRAALAGFVFAMGWFGAGVSWVYVSMHDVGGMPAAIAGLATLLFAAILAAYWALAGWVHSRIATATWRHLLFVTPSVITLAEWLRSWVFTGFPWIGPGYAYTDGPLAGFAPLVGVFGMTYLAALLGALLASGYSTERTKQRILVLGAVGLVMLGGHLLKTLTWTTPAGAPLQVRLVQGNIPQDLKFVPGRFESTVDRYLGLSGGPATQLILLPETALPRMLHAIPREVLDRFDRLARQQGATLITGVPRSEPGLPAGAAANRPRTTAPYFNSAVSLGLEAGQGYDKSHLVPFGEFIPFGFRWFVNLMNMPLGDFSRGGVGQTPIQVAGQQIAVNICYEDLFGEEIITALPKATILANISNLAWFGDSLAPHQHLQASRMRAIEAGRPVLRATNTGATAAIDYDGRTIDMLPFFSAGVLNTNVQGRSGMTPYALGGNLPLILFCVVALGWSALARGAKRLLPADAQG